MGLPNHDGEDSENWDAFYYPIGDAESSARGDRAYRGGRISV